VFWTLVSVGAAICVALAADTSAPAAIGSADLRLTGFQTKRTNVDVNPRGRSAGDSDIITVTLYDGVTAAPIGGGTLLCIFLGQASSSCTATYGLPQGRITTAGVIDNPRRYVVAITGGTELYDNARGTLAVTTTALNPRRELLVFHLVDQAAPQPVVPSAVRPPATAQRASPRQAFSRLRPPGQAKHSKLPRGHGSHHGR
jgi:hypothetical protein